MKCSLVGQWKTCELAREKLANVPASGGYGRMEWKQLSKEVQNLAAREVRSCPCD